MPKETLDYEVRGNLRLIKRQIRHNDGTQNIMEATQNIMEGTQNIMLVFFQARPRRIEIKTSQLFRMPQAHHRSCDKNQPISFLTFSITLKPQQKNGGAAHYCGPGISWTLWLVKPSLFWLK